MWQNEDGSTQNFYDAESFRQVVEEQHIEEELRALLPRPEGKPIEKPAEAGLRERMCAHLKNPPLPFPYPQPSTQPPITLSRAASYTP